MTTEAKALQAELGRGEAIDYYVAEAGATIAILAPGLAYNRTDLHGFVAAAWPCEGPPEDVAGQFVDSLGDATEVG